MTRAKRTHLEVDWQLVEEVERDGDRFDVAVSLLLVVDDRLEEDDALVLRGKHLHECLHEVLWVPTFANISLELLKAAKTAEWASQTHLDLIPSLLLINLQAAEIVLDRHNAAVTRHEFLILHQGEVNACAERDDGGFRRSAFVRVAHRTAVREGGG